VSTHCCFVNADHAGNLVTRRSQSGILLFVNRAPIIWYSKRQNTVETSTFGSELVTLRIAVEFIESFMWYKLRRSLEISPDTTDFIHKSSHTRPTVRKL
jgi:hypothetical protein